MQPIRMLLVEDLALMREGIRAALHSARDVQIVGEAGDEREAVHLTETLKPDVALVDQDLAAADGIAVIRMLKRVSPHTEAILMTDRLDDEKALQAIEAGAMGYVLKEIAGANLAGAVRQVCHGRAFLHPTVSRNLADQLGRIARANRIWQRLRSEGLTQRELDILLEVAKGSTDLEIANRFVVAEGTIKTHIRHILRKLSARNRAQAVAFVLRKGLIK